MAHASHLFFETFDCHVFFQIPFNIWNGQQFLNWGHDFFIHFFLLSIIQNNSRGVRAHPVEAEKFIKAFSLHLPDLDLVCSINSFWSTALALPLMFSPSLSE